MLRRDKKSWRHCSFNFRRKEHEGMHSHQPTALFLATCSWSGVSFHIVFPMARAANASWAPKGCSFACCLRLDGNVNAWPAYYRGTGDFRSLPGKNMAESNLSHHGTHVSFSSEGRKGSTLCWSCFCLSTALAASVWKARIVSLCFVIGFPMVVSVTYLTLFELIKLGNQGKHISGGDLLPKDISAEGGKKEISLYVQHSRAVS